MVIHQSPYRSSENAQGMVYDTGIEKSSTNERVFEFLIERKTTRQCSQSSPQPTTPTILEEPHQC